MKLHLHVKTIYFEQIRSGEKIEEYRIASEYWVNRLVGRYYGGVVIWNGYKTGAANRIEFPWIGCTLKEITHPHFGDKPAWVFAIRLHPWGDGR